MIERCLVFEAGREIDDVLFFNHGVLKYRGAAAGCALTEAVPVVALTDARLLDPDSRDHVRAVVIALGIYVDPVGEETAGAVELGAIHHPLLTLAADASNDLADFHAAHLGPGIADQFTGDEAFEPDLLGACGVGVETVLDKRQVAAQRLWQIGVGFGQFDQQLKQLRQRGAGSAVFDRNTDRTKTGLFQPLDLLVGQYAVAFALHRTFGDTRKNRPETRSELLVVGAKGQGG